MKICYVYDIAGNPITQLFDIVKFECTKNINNYDTGSFEISMEYWNKTIFHLLNRVVVSEVTPDGEITYIDWLVTGRKPQVWKMTVYLKSAERLLEKTNCDDNKNYNGTVTSIIDDVVAEYNARSWRTLTADCGVATVRAGKFTSWSKLKDILNKIAESWYEYKITNNVLVFKESIGVDYSVWSEFIPQVLFKLDIRDFDDRNIEDMTLIIDADKVVNAPFEKSAGFVTDAGSIAEYGRLESNITGSGDIATTLAKIIEEQAVEVIQSDIKVPIEEFTQFEVGDKVAVYVYLWEDQDNFEWSTKVVKKTYSDNWIEVWLSQNAVRSKNIIEKIEEYENRIAQIENEL